VATPSRKWRQNQEPRLPFVAKDPLRKVKDDLTLLTPAIRKKIFIVLSWPTPRRKLTRLRS
jgi:hypothetical protein